MMRKLIPTLLALVGLGSGMGIGIALRTPPPIASDSEQVSTAGEGKVIDKDMLPEYVKLSNPFIVPLLEDGRVESLIVLSLSIEVKKGTTESVYAREPKLQHMFLQVMFDHANAGGFRGSFTDSVNLLELRKALLEVGMTALGEIVSDVLIVDIIRQDS